MKRENKNMTEKEYVERELESLMSKTLELEEVLFEM